jgi:predicted RNA-binding protein associated with RNAse of E/G family
MRCRVAPEHTPPPESPAGRRTIIERKQKADGTIREYACVLLHMDGSVAIVEFLMAKGGAIYGTPIDVPPGSISHGYFWKRRDYNLYRMRDPGGAIIAHRFDAVADVRFADDAVSYRDLILDWWVTPTDELIEEDRDEFDAAVTAGTVSPGDLAATRRAEHAIYTRYRHIIDDVAKLERRLGTGPAG